MGMTSVRDYGDIGRHYVDYTAMCNRAKVHRRNYEYYQVEAERNFKAAELADSRAFTFSTTDEGISQSPNELNEHRYRLKRVGYLCLVGALNAEINLHNLDYEIAQHTREASNHFKAHADQYYDQALQLATQSGLIINH